MIGFPLAVNAKGNAAFLPTSVILQRPSAATILSKSLHTHWSGDAPSRWWALTLCWWRLDFAKLQTVKRQLRTLALFAVLIAPHLAAARGHVIVPQITLEDAPFSAPSVTFTIPRYELSQRERETIAACLILEAASQGDIGLRAVMAVIRNRARGVPELFEPTVLREKQFSALNKVTAGRETLTQAIQRAKRDRMWDRAMSIVDAALDESWHDPTGGATHYTRSGERTRWTRSLARTAVIGAHSFYR